MTKQQMERTALIAAGVVIVVLTAGAFWLSYAHLAEVAGQHGLAATPIRRWAWPATLDLFIVGGELLMLRAGLQGRTDWWAICCTAAGSVGSIALNVAGVTGTREADQVPLLDYVTAAVPPTAALLAFGLLMRQIHGLVADPVPVVAVDPVSTPADPGPVLDSEPELPQADAQVEPVDASTGPKALEPADVGTAELVRLSTEEARRVIENGWRQGLSTRETAELATRHHSYVGRVYTQLEDQHGPQPTPGQTELNVLAA
jgi:uncharacterized protein DUF2637